MDVMGRIAEIAAAHHVALERDVPLARYTFFGVGGPMRALLRPTRVAALPGLLRDLAAEGLPPRLLGCGTNLVAGDVTEVGDELLRLLRAEATATPSGAC